MIRQPDEATQTQQTASPTSSSSKTVTSNQSALNDFMAENHMSQDLQRVSIVGDNAHSHSQDFGDSSQTSLDLMLLKDTSSSSNSNSKGSIDKPEKATTTATKQPSSTSSSNPSLESSSSTWVETINAEDIVAGHYRDIINDPDIKRVSIVSDNAFTHDFDSGPVDYDDDEEEEEEEEEALINVTQNMIVIDLDDGKEQGQEMSSQVAFPLVAVPSGTTSSQQQEQLPKQQQQQLPVCDSRQKTNKTPCVDSTCRRDLP